MNNAIQFLIILRARYPIALLVFVLVVAAVGLWNWAAREKYTATAVVVIDYRGNDPFSQQSSVVQMSPSYMATQVDIIGSYKVALKVIDDLKLANNPAIKANFEQSTKGKGSVADWLADILLKDLDVKPGRESRVVNISFTAVDPQFAAVVADAFAEAYIATSLELSIDPARRNAEWFDGQIKTLRSKMEDTQNALTAYQRSKGIAAADERLDTETKRLSDLATQLVVAQGEAMDVRSRQLGAHHPQYQHAMAREAEARSAFERQKEKLLSLKNQRDDIAVLVRDAETAQHVYETALQRFNTATLESHVNQTNVVILSRAAVPLMPSSPKIGRNMAIASLLGAMLGVAAAFGTEMLRRQVRTKDDVETALNIPLLGSVTYGAA